MKCLKRPLFYQILFKIRKEKNQLLKRKVFSKDKEKDEKKNDVQTLDALINRFKTGKNQTYEPPISDRLKLAIEHDLKKKDPQKILKAVEDKAVKEALTEQVIKDYGHQFSGSLEKKREIAEYIIREVVGTGIMEAILQFPDITDVGWNGTHLSIETNNEKILLEGSELGITHEYIERVIQKYAVVNDHEFNNATMQFDGMFDHVRINAVHEMISPSGATLSLRIARPKLILNPSNFEGFAPSYMLELLEKIVQTGANITISGETGAGKTELQKLLLSFVQPRERIVMIEDTQETHAKELFPEKDIYSWLTGGRISISELVRASLRNNPKWIIVSETRGKEAYEMFQAVLSGHYIITTLHSVDARAIPRRFVNMCSTGYQINEKTVEEDIYRYFDFGIHIKTTNVNGYKHRYLSEVVEFNPSGATTVFEQSLVNGKWVQRVGSLSSSYKKRMLEKNITSEFPKSLERNVKEEHEKKN